jgi:glutaminyl-peptide cyclotransferase
MQRAQVVFWLATLVAIPELLVAAPGDFSGASALNFTRKVVEFGPRPPDSDAIHNLQNYLRTQVKSLGWAVSEDVFQANTPVGPKQMRSIIARLPGTSGKIVAISGHYDTKPTPGVPFVGANDGGSSTGLLLELARVLPKRSHKDEILLVWLDGEEAFVQWSDTDSVYGSKHLAAKWAADGTAQRIKALINVDMIGDQDLQIVEETASTVWLRELVWDTARELGFAKHFGPSQGVIGDDHVPFLDKGIPALDLIDFDYGPGNSYWHTPQDTMDKLDANSFEVVGKVVLAVIQKLEDKK